LELETEILVALNLGYIKPEDCESVTCLITEISKMLNSLVSKLEIKEKNNQTQSPKH